MSLIYYLGYYDTEENKSENRVNVLAATNKMTYIVSALENLGHTVQIVSPSGTLLPRFFRGKTLPVGQRSNVKLFATVPHTPRPIRILGRVFLRAQTMWYLLRHINEDDTVIVYHSLALINRVKWLKKLTKCKLILEVEEIYGDVMENPKVSNREMTYFQIADGYLYAAKRLEQKTNSGQKPYAMIHGTYKVEDDKKSVFTEPQWQNKIHCVYAGTLDPRKGGGATAIKAAEHLPENYHIHILGTGDKHNLDIIQDLITEVSKKTKCGISYDGFRSGSDFSHYLQKCQIGLSTQDPNGAFNDTSFPSKILTYMANGLQVVTVRIPVVEESAIDEFMHYYDEPTPKQIAAAIQAAAESANAQDGRNIVAKLDQDFTRELSKLLEEL